MRNKQDKIDAGDFIINLSNSMIIKDGKEIDLTKNELKIFKYLNEKRGKIVSREEIMDYLWESNSFINECQEGFITMSTSHTNIGIILVQNLIKYIRK